MDQVFTDHDKDVIEMKMKAERMWSSCPSKRERRSLACREIPGYSYFGDNIGNRIAWTLVPTLVLIIAYIVGKVVNQRHNTDLEHKGEYLHMAQVLAIENRIPSAHCSDTPLMEATDVNYYPGADDLALIRSWCKFTIGKALTKYFPPAKSCNKYLR